MSSILQMRYFLVLAKYENLAKASAELHLSPSTLSKSIGRLEDEIGVKLFDRSEKGLKLNRAGHIAMESYSQAIHILDDMCTAIADIHNNDPQTLQILSVSNLSGIDLITAFKSEYPNHHIIFKTISSDAILDVSVRNKFDFIIAGPVLLCDSTLNSQPIGDSSPVLLVPKGHPLTLLEDISLADISKYPLVLSPAGTPWEQYLTSAFQLAGFSPNIVDSGTHALRCQMVASGAGISISTQNGARLSPPPSTVDILPLSGVFPKRYTYLYWNNRRHVTKSMQCFQTFATKWFQFKDPC